jgi:hypothetical protein
MNIADVSVYVTAYNVWNYGQLLAVWTAWRHYVSGRAVQFMSANLFMIFSSGRKLSAPISRLFSVTVSEQCVPSWSGILQRKGISIWHVKYWFARKRRKFWRKFRDERVPSAQTIKNFLYTLISRGLLIVTKQIYKRRVHTEEKSDDIGVRLEHTPREFPVNYERMNCSCITNIWRVKCGWHAKILVEYYLL